ncbi:MAG: hypothetical protein ABI396_06825 [Ktedonobacteraceae bacterium]
MAKRIVSPECCAKKRQKRLHSHRDARLIVFLDSYGRAYSLYQNVSAIFTSIEVLYLLILISPGIMIILFNAIILFGYCKK